MYKLFGATLVYLTLQAGAGFSLMGQSRPEWEYFGPEQGLGMSFLDIIQDSKGFIWLGSTNGLYRYDGYKFESFKKYTNRPTGLSSDWVWDLEEDARGNIWIATYDGGINMWERSTGQFRHFRHEPANAQSLSGDKVFKILPDKQGQVWAVVQNQNGIPVLDKLDPATGKVRRYRHEPVNARSLSCDTLSVPGHRVVAVGAAFRPGRGRSLDFKHQPATLQTGRRSAKPARGTLAERSRGPIRAFRTLQRQSAARPAGDQPGAGEPGIR